MSSFGVEQTLLVLGVERPWEGLGDGGAEGLLKTVMIGGGGKTLAPRAASLGVSVVNFFN